MRTVHILKADIDSILELCPVCMGVAKVGACSCRFTSQSEAVIALYKLIYPEWEEIESVNGFPQCHKSTGDYIMRKFMAFDRRHHPNVMAGGLWMNNGWGTLAGKDLHEFEAVPCEVSLKARSALEQAA